jgi:nitric oxide reductase NorD protein
MIREADLEYYKNTIEKNGIILRSIRKQFANFFNKMIEIKRVENGDNLNIDALTDLISDIYSGHTPNEKIYDSKRKKQKDISILFLLDQSLSSDGYAAGNKIIDVEKQIAILMGEVLNEYEIEFQIDGFSSKTRNNCSYNTVKSFDSNWKESRSNIAALQPSGYTRMGPALRHANYLLKKRETRSRWIVFLTDGKPNDYDKYEGRYGIADVKQALREIHQSFNSIHAFAIEQNAKYYLPLMFGTRNYNVLSNAKEMTNALTKFVERIINT